MQDADIANEHVAREFQTDRFVSPPVFHGVARIWIAKRRDLRIVGHVGERVVLLFCARLVATTDQTLSPDSSRTEDRDVFQVLAPNQTVPEVAVTKVLKLVPGVRLWRVVLAVAVVRMCSENGGAV